MKKENTKILMVDDDASFLETYILEFEKAGITIETAESAEKALEKIEAGLLPHIIFTDIEMPGKNGLELIEEIKQKNLAPQALLIILTSELVFPRYDRAKQLGAYTFLVKRNVTPEFIVSETLKILEANKE